MRLVSLKIKNFRGYKDTVEIPFDNLTVFVGKNDVGKSTILDALEIFFHDGKGCVKYEKSDLNVEEREDNSETEISACFTEFPNKIVIDTTNTTSLQDEYLLNSNGHLEIVKKYKGSTIKVFVRANHPSNEKCNNLLSKKNSELKQIVNTEKLTCENNTVNSMLRKTIWDKYKNELQLKECEIDISKEDGKKIWEKMAAYLPVYSLFQSDRKNSDGDNEVQDPLRMAVKQLMSDTNIQESLSKIADEVRGKLKEISDNTLAKIKEMDPEVANSLTPEIPSDDKLKWFDVFKEVSISGDNNIPINKRGSGIRRLVLLNFFRAEAEKKEVNGNGVIYAFEEPETSQHSDKQILLINSLKSLAKKQGAQVVLTTHSAYIVKQLEFSNVRLIRNKNNTHKSIENVTPNILRYPSLNEVNYVAFEEASTEYHDELFSCIKSNNLLTEYKNKHQDKTNIKEIMIKE
ncbi:MAG: ATP-binding protein [Succinivibrio sp.]